VKPFKPKVRRSYEYDVKTGLLLIRSSASLASRRRSAKRRRERADAATARAAEIAARRAAMRLVWDADAPKGEC